LELKEAVVVSDQVQTEKIKNNNDGKPVEEKNEKTPEKPESDELQKLAKERIERVKKAFRPRWTINQIDSQDNKKGK
jgi:hypothetical protein